VTVVEAQPPAPPNDAGPRWHGPALFAGLVVLLALPLAIALGVLRTPRWFPLLDLSQTELRVRDVWSSHPPLIGLAGRIGPFGRQGSHLGPMSFYSLWPFYQLFGAGSWALEAATVALNTIAAGLSLWIAKRRGGIALLLGMALVLAVLMHAYGAYLLTQAWNPFLPAMWWIVFLLAVWSVLCDDWPMLVAGVVAGSFCMQTHISYLGLIGGIAAVTVGVVAYQVYAKRDDREARSSLLRWTAIAAGVGVLLWIPPVIDQIVHDPGNFTVVKDHFSDPPESPVGLREGVRVFLAELNPVRLFTETLGQGRTSAATSSVLPGILLLLAWGASFLAAWRLRLRTIVRLDVVLAVASVLGVISAMRIFGYLWFYLVLWVAALSALMVVAVVWTAAEVVGRRASSSDRAKGARFGALALVVGLVVVVVAFSFDATSASIPEAAVSETVGALAPPTEAALQVRDEEEPYIITWLPDPLSIGGAGYGLFNELERRGFELGVDTQHAPGATRYRLVKPDDASLEVHIALGSAIDEWRREHPEFDEVAFYDPRTPKERAEFRRLRGEVIGELEAAGLHELVRAVDENLFAFLEDDRVPESTRDLLARMAALGLPGAVFLGPPVTIEAAGPGVRGS
jgi:hypothetical protein